MMSLPAPVEAQEIFTPTLELVTAMRKYSDDMRKAGVLLLAEGLHPSSKATRIQVSNGKRVFTDGPFTEAKEMIAGFWLISVKSREEALE
ncbi:MAG TPA: YciI family protein, partial [Candidatus Acidoferrum sp.]|nr:YciI family protein [Candidatus Acidoferrum sp.]